MAGLIQKQMQGSAQDEMNEREPVEGQGPDGSAQHEGMEGEAPEQNDQSAENPESNPNFKAAVELAMKTLYSDGAAKDVATQLKAAGGKVDGMATVAYDITQVIDDRTQGAIPDELLIPFAMRVLEEVVEIADAAGLDPQPEEVAESFQKMILRYLSESGVDTSQLQQAMNQVDPSVFRQAAQQ